MREFRCPECQRYCEEHPLEPKAYCPNDGWFRQQEATHTINRE
jgi:hypothetical protein